MRNADELVAEGTVYAMSLALDATMMRDAAARARYLAIYGREWSMCSVVETVSTKSTALSTTLGTVR